MAGTGVVLFALLLVLETLLLGNPLVIATFETVFRSMPRGGGQPAFDARVSGRHKFVVWTGPQETLPQHLRSLVHSNRILIK